MSGSGWRGVDFQLPDGNGNVITAIQDGRPRYIDVHSFKVLCDDVGLQLQPASEDTVEASPAPDSARELKRKTEFSGTRSTAEPLERLLRTVGKSLKGKLVLDTTSSFEPAMLNCLRHGAAWLHAWIPADQIAVAEQMLLSSGLTRASFSPPSTSSNGGTVDMPLHLERFAEHQVVVRTSSAQLAGWSGRFAKLKWTLMFYEHGEGEDLKHAMRSLKAAYRLGQDEAAGFASELPRVALLERGFQDGA